MTTSMMVASYFCALVFVGLFFWIAAALRMAYTQMDLLLELLKNCSVVTDHAFLKDTGPGGKLLLVGGISGVVTFPGIHIKHGRACIDDLSNFPAPLKRKLTALQLSGLGLLSSLVLIVGFVEVIKMYGI